MVTKIGSSMLSDVVDALCEEESYQAVYHMPEHDRPMPSLEALTELVERLRAVIFPGYFGDSEIRPETMRYHIGGSLDIAYRILVEQVMRGHCFFCDTDDRTCTDCETAAKRIGAEFMATLPEMRRLLAADVQAAYVGDPASKSSGETIFCYPSITALTHHRIAHELYKLKVDLIPRIIGEMAHSKTGIDIHPGAQIGDHFFIDHGTGTVIGETCVIGSNVRLYQGVTLGAKSFPQDDSGKLIKGIPRHPIVEDNTIVYSGATILGRVTIGAGSVIGGNVWVTRDVEPGARLLQSK
ncbi:MAG: serine acetyltransferase [Desulfovibrio sp. S3730MH75]|nr:MAG: serine acetyltransferase [Desulfovibrio sp. S3730MH75]